MESQNNLELIGTMLSATQAMENDQKFVARARDRAQTIRQAALQQAVGVHENYEAGIKPTGQQFKLPVAGDIPAMAGGRPAACPRCGAALAHGTPVCGACGATCWPARPLFTGLMRRR